MKHSGRRGLKDRLAKFLVDANVIDGEQLRKSLVTEYMNIAYFEQTCVKIMLLNLWWRMRTLNNKEERKCPEYIAISSIHLSTCSAFHQLSWFPSRVYPTRFSKLKYRADLGNPTRFRRQDDQTNIATRRFKWLPEGLRLTEQLIYLLGEVRQTRYSLYPSTTGAGEHGVASFFTWLVGSLKS